MFRACHAHHQEKQIVSIKASGNCHSELVAVTITRSCIDAVSPDDEHDMLETCREL